MDLGEVPLGCDNDIGSKLAVVLEKDLVEVLLTFLDPGFLLLLDGSLGSLEGDSGLSRWLGWDFIANSLEHQDSNQNQQCKSDTFSHLAGLLLSLTEIGDSKVSSEAESTSMIPEIVAAPSSPAVEIFRR
jgi:hypothetical protein